MSCIKKRSFGGFLTCILFLWCYGGLTVLPIVDGQYETPNNGCGGIFRYITGSINFTLNHLTYPNAGDRNKTCLWTILPNPTWSQFKITFTRFVLDPDDKLALTTYQENRKALTQTIRKTSGDGETIMSGNVLVVTFISPSFDDSGRKGFRMVWDKTESAQRVQNYRFTVPYYSYGKTSSEPNPYFAAGFMGNSLSTFGFTKGNNTEGFALQFKFHKIELLSQYCNASYSCDTLLISRISDSDATLRDVYAWDTNVTETELPTMQNKFGYFFIMWGGNFFNSSGGGRMQLEYASVRE